MTRDVPKSYLNVVLMLGAVWGLSEAGLGMWLKTCASSVSGSLMTGVALFFLASCWAVSMRFIGVALLVVTVSLFKLFDALLLALPVQHGAVANPMFAFILEGVAFFVLITIFKQRISQKKIGQAFLGGAAALLAVGLFPLVKFVTGIPACVVAGTSIPLSIYYAPIAMLVSLVSVPLGFWVGAKAKTTLAELEEMNQRRYLRYPVSTITLIICMAIMALIRLG